MNALHDALSQLRSIFQQKPLTEAKFNEIAFSNDHPDRDIALKSVLAYPSYARLANLKTLIEVQKITSLSDLAEVTPTSDKDTTEIGNFREQYGVEQIFCEFQLANANSLRIANVAAIQESNESVFVTMLCAYITQNLLTNNALPTPYIHLFNKDHENRSEYRSAVLKIYHLIDLIGASSNAQTLRDKADQFFGKIENCKDPTEIEKFYNQSKAIITQAKKIEPNVYKEIGVFKFMINLVWCCTLVLPLIKQLQTGSALLFYTSTYKHANTLLNTLKEMKTNNEPQNTHPFWGCLFKPNRNSRVYPAEADSANGSSPINV